MAQTKLMTLARQQQYDQLLKEFLANADAQVLDSAKKYADGLATKYDAAGTAQTVVNELSETVNALGTIAYNNQSSIGTLSELGTTDKDNLVDAINEVRNSVSAGGTAAAITISTATTTEGAAKSYTVKQGDNTVGVIDIPKDMVVQSGEVVTNPEGQAAGTYIKLTLANATNDEIYVNVGTLVDIYTAQSSATQIQLAINSTTREISATIVAGSVTATELAANAVTTAKIANGNVTKAKLSTDVQASLDKADSALDDAKAYTDQQVEANKVLVEDVLDSDSEVNALSAKQGKNLNNQIGVVRNDLESTMTNVNTNYNSILALQEKVGDGFIEVTEAEISAMFSA